MTLPAVDKKLLDQALAQLEKGLHVFPLGGHGETPPDYFVKERFDGDQDKARAAWPKQPRLAWKPFQYAPPTEETVRKWWTQWPNANIGIACGELIVVDADSKASSEWCMANLPATPWRVRTGTEGKCHFYFRRNPNCEIRNSTDALAKIDTRGMGGYVVAGGSRHASGRWYENDIDPSVANLVVSDLPMLTKVHVDAIAAYRAANITQDPQKDSHAGNLEGFDASGVRAPADGSPVLEGGRNDAAASLAGQYIAQGMSLRDTKTLLDGWNASNPRPLSDSELNTTIASVKATHERNHPGQTIPLVTPFREPDVTLDSHLVALDDRTDCDEPLPHYVERWIPEGEVTLLAGHGGGGKSYVALILAVCVALGLPFAGLATKQSNVLFFSAEDGKRVLLYRLRRICRAMNCDVASLKGRVHLLDASDLDPALHREQRTNIGGRQSFVFGTPMLVALADLIKRLDAGLVVIDNASDAYDDDEIRRSRVRTFIRDLRSKIARPRRAVLLLAHVNKVSAILKKGGGSEDYSGSTAWHNSVRSRLSLLSDAESDTMTIEHAKANLGPKSPPVQLEWQDGVPVAAGTQPSPVAEFAKKLVRDAEDARDEQDMLALEQLIKSFDARGELIGTSVSGPATPYRVLKGEEGFPKKMGPDRLNPLLRRMESRGRIYRRTVRTDNRKKKQVFTCAPEMQSAPTPVAGQGDELVDQGEACANES